MGWNKIYIYSNITTATTMKQQKYEKYGETNVKEDKKKYEKERGRL